MQTSGSTFRRGVVCVNGDYRPEINGDEGLCRGRGVNGHDLCSWGEKETGKRHKERRNVGRIARASLTEQHHLRFCMLRTKKKRAAHFSQLRVYIVLDATDDVSIRPLEAFPIEFGWCSMRINTLQTQSQQARSIPCKHNHNKQDMVLVFTATHRVAAGGGRLQVSAPFWTRALRRANSVSNENVVSMCESSQVAR